VVGRRLTKGPLHPGWSFRYEVIATVMRVVQERITRMPITELRKHTLPTRVHIALWHAVQHQRSSFAGLYAEFFTPRGYGPTSPTILYFHGGGYIACSPATHRDLISRIAAETGARCIAVDYRKAPEYPFPAPIDDCEVAYRVLLDEVDASRVFLAGDSAGGALVLAVLLRARAAGLAMPKAAVLLSPWVDLSCQGESVKTNALYDYLTHEALELSVNHYLQGQDRLHPHVSPVHAELHGLPPLLLLTGGAELFLSENVAFAERARAHGVDLSHYVEEGMVHVSSLFATVAPASRHALSLIGEFVRKHGAAGGLEAGEQATATALHVQSGGQTWRRAANG
jgi:monoterpene epsilon-lactone hydrolase